ncbi:MAG TPA: hypothetical protein PKH03_03895 [Syntrophales bacterium]|nr:hypothetical protein [Syntrophales bacterium]
MFEREYILREPLFYLFVVTTILLTVGYFQGRRRNRRIFLDAFQALVDTVNPDDQTYTTIGGVVGYHANLLLKRKGPVSRVDATITLLPRQSWLYLPISLLTMRFDRLFVTIHLKSDVPGEGHLIERSYSRFRGPKIANEARLEKETVRWGKLDFILYYDNLNVRERFRDHLVRHPDPGTIRHIALVPGDRKGFVFMIPKRGRVATMFRPVYELITSLASDAKKGKTP